MDVSEEDNLRDYSVAQPSSFAYSRLYLSFMIIGVVRFVENNFYSVCNGC